MHGDNELAFRILTMSSLYLHIPFCLKKCQYCAFTSQVATAKEKEFYLTALKKELESVSKSAGALKTIFLGGGTPTSLEVDGLSGLISFIKDHFAITEHAEISVEANPETIDRGYCRKLRKAGINRLSLGVQSFLDDELATLGRIHDTKSAIRAIKDIQEAGFTNINIDLMYGLPGQTPGSWQKSLETALALNPRHLSLYQLMIEEGTAFNRLYDTGKLVLPTEEDVLQMDALTAELTISASFTQYETSNYSLEGFHCRHNINYWENNDYYAAGAAAVSYLQGVREKRIADHREYSKKMLAGEGVIIESECLSRDQSFRETVIMGLRMIRGVDLRTLKDRYGMEPLDHYGSTLKTLIDSEMVELTPTHLRLSKKGAPLANMVMAELV